MGKRSFDKLNVVKYYGSKAVLCDEIIDRVAKNCKVYLELFGAGASVLLNKVPHEIEIYNELNTGVYTLFFVLSNKDKGNKLKKCLENVCYTEKSFYDALEYSNAIENNPFNEILRKMELYIKKIEKRYNLSLYKEYKNSNAENKDIDNNLRKIKICFSEDDEGERLLQEYMRLEDDFYREDGEQLLKELNSCIKKYRGKYKKELPELGEIDISDNSADDINKDVRNRKTIILKCAKRLKYLMEIKDLIEEYCETFEKKELINLRKKYDDMIKKQKNHQKRKNDYDELELAKATFIIYNMSRDGIGKSFSDLSDGQRKFDMKVNNLPDVIKRLKKVIILHESVFDMLDRKKLEQAVLEKGFDISGISDEEMVYYFEPPYLEDESITARKTKDRKGNPGKVYKCGFDIEQHKLFLEKICHHKANMLVSNYRDSYKTYDTYLSKENGWTYTEYPTITTVGGTRGQRTEILWQNY